MGSLSDIYPENPDIRKLWESMTVVCMKQAEYFAASVRTPDQWRHYALAIPYYTHFTSPIRRYADVVVHRLLQETISHGEGI